MHVHRHFKYLDDTLFLMNISYQLENSMIVLKNFTMHSVLDDVINPNFVKKQLNEFNQFALDHIFDILKTDGVIDYHK